MKDARMILMKYFADIKKSVKANELAGALMRLPIYSEDEHVSSSEHYDYKNYIVFLEFPSGEVEYIRYRKYTDDKVPSKWFFDWANNVSVVTEDLVGGVKETVTELASFEPADNTPDESYKPSTTIERFIIKNCKIKSEGITKELVVASLFAYQVKSLGQKGKANGVPSVETNVNVGKMTIRYMRPTDLPKFDRASFDFNDVIFAEVAEEKPKETVKTKAKEVKKEKEEEEVLPPEEDVVAEHNVGDYEPDSVTSFDEAVDADVIDAEDVIEVGPDEKDLAEFEELDKDIVEPEKESSGPAAFPAFNPEGDVDYEALGRYVAENCIRNEKGLFVDKAVISEYDIKKDTVVAAIMAQAVVLEKASARVREEIDKALEEWREYSLMVEKPVSGNITLRSYDGMDKITCTPTKKENDSDTIRVYSKKNETGSLTMLKLGLN